MQILDFDSYYLGVVVGCSVNNEQTLWFHLLCFTYCCLLALGCNVAIT